MSGMLLSCADMPVIKQVADLLGFVMNALFFVFNEIGIANIGLCIIVFTLIIKLLMIPMSIKQQKTTKLSSVMQPEILAIQKKYKNKKDNESMMAMNAETKAVYAKYGSSPTGGCLPMLLQMCILLALYGVISNIPGHVGLVEDMYKSASESISLSIDEYDELNRVNQIMVDNKIENFEEEKKYDEILEAYYESSSKDIEEIENDIYKILSNSYTRQAKGLDVSEDAWDDMSNLKSTSIKILETLKNTDKDVWKNIDKSDLNEYEITIISEYEKYDSSDYDNLIVSVSENYEEMEEKHQEIIDVYTFAGIDLSRSPSQEMQVGIWWAILIPILSAVSQWLSTFLATKNSNNQAMQDNPMMSSMKMMNIVMPIMSAFFCYSFAAGLGLYWIIGAVFTAGQQIFINSYFKNVEVEDIIKSNIEKQNKKRAKQGLPPQKITAAANTNVKNIKSNTANINIEDSDSKPKTSGVTYKKGGIAAKANMVKQYNDNNTK